VLRFEMIHRHFEHIVAADANAMNFRPGLAVGGLFVFFFRGMCLAHGRILARLARVFPPVSFCPAAGILSAEVRHLYSLLSDFRSRAS
jgi:hypothetical protein